MAHGHHWPNLSLTTPCFLSWRSAPSLLPSPIPSPQHSLLKSYLLPSPDDRVLKLCSQGSFHLPPLRDPSLPSWQTMVLPESLRWPTMGAALYLRPGADSGVKGALGNTKAAIYQMPSESRLVSGAREAKRKKCQWRLPGGLRLACL